MNEGAFEVKYISGDAPTQLRKAHLRTAGMAPYKNYPTADEPGNFHLGAYMDGELAAAASFLQERCPHFDEAVQYRLRGMVTHPDYRGMGMGKALLTRAVDILKGRQAHILWFDARTSAVGFYEKCGFAPIGEPFMVPRICMHQVMYLRL